MVTAVSFDGDQTLWDLQALMRRSLGVVLAELRRRRPGPQTRLLTVDRMIDVRNRVAQELRGQETNLERVRLHAFRETLEAIGAPEAELAAQMNDLYLEHRFKDVKLYVDVLPALDALRGEYRLGLVSNGNGYPDGCGLAERLDFVVFSQDHGVEKPDRRIFEIAERAAGVPPGDIIHVGDSPSDDVRGAQAAGWRAALLSRDHPPHEPDLRPDLRISSLADLPEALHSLS